MITQGNAAHPVKLNDHFFGPKIKEVHWGGIIGVLIVDIPEGIIPTFADPLFSSLMNSKAIGDIVTHEDFAKYTDGTGEHPSPISELLRPKIELSTLYGEGNRAWAVRALMRGFGADPGENVRPSPFPPDEGIPPNHFPNPIWEAYRDDYNRAKSDFLRDHPEGRWIEVADLRSLGSDTLITGPARAYFGPGETWADLDYGEIALYHYELQPYVPPHYTIFGVQAYRTVLVDIDARAPGNIGYAPYGFNSFEAVRIASWGIGEEEVAGNPGRKAIRIIYFFDFKIIEDQIISVSMVGTGVDHNISSYLVKFRFALFGRATKFTLTNNLFTVDHPASYDQTKSFPYTQAGELFKVNKRGFVA